MFQTNVQTQTEIKAYKDKSGLWGHRVAEQKCLNLVMHGSECRVTYTAPKRIKKSSISIVSSFNQHSGNSDHAKVV